MFSIFSKAAWAAARLDDVGAFAATAAANAAGSNSGNPIAGVLYVLMGSRSGNATPLLPRIFRFLLFVKSLSLSFSVLSISPSLM